MRDLPAIMTRSPGSKAGAMEKSRSARLSDAQVVGAKNWSSWSAGESSSTESLWS